MSLSWVQRAAGSTIAAGPMSVNPATGAVIQYTNNGVFKSTDGGQTWNAVSGPSPGSVSGGIGFGNGVFIIEYSGGLWRSNNDGASWTNPTAPSGISSSNLSAALAFSPTLGSGQGMWLFVQGTFFSTSVDGGVTWTAMAGISSLSSGAHVTNNILWDGSRFAFTGRDAANANGVIAYSSDGSTWSTVVIGSIFGNDEPFSMSYAGGSYILGMTGSVHLRQASTLAGLATASDTDLSLILTGIGTPITAVFTPDGILSLASASYTGGTNNVLAEQDSSAGLWVASPSPFTGNEHVVFFVYDLFHRVLIGSATGATAFIITAPYTTTPGVSITPASANVPVNGGTFNFSFISNDGSHATPALNGIPYGNASTGFINDAGYYVAPIGLSGLPSPNTVTLTLTLDKDHTKTATAVITLVAPTQPINAYGAFRGPTAFRPVSLVNVGAIVPKIYAPGENITVKSQS